MSLLSKRLMMASGDSIPGFTTYVYAHAESGTSINVNKPTSVASGRTMLAFAEYESTNASGSITSMTGWTTLSNATYNAISGVDTVTYVFHKTAGGSEPSSYTVSTDQGSGGAWRVVIVDVGVIANLVGSVKAAPSFTASHTTNTIAFPTDGQILTFWPSLHDITFTTPPATQTLIVQDTSLVGGDIWLGYEDNSAGGTGSRSMTTSGSARVNATIVSFDFA